MVCGAGLLCVASLHSLVAVFPMALHYDLFLVSRPGLVWLDLHRVSCPKGFSRPCTDAQHSTCEPAQPLAPWLPARAAAVWAAGVALDVRAGRALTMCVSS